MRKRIVRQVGYLQRVSTVVNILCLLFPVYNSEASLRFRIMPNEHAAVTSHGTVFILFLSFRRVVNVIYSFLGNSPASEI